MKKLSERIDYFVCYECQRLVPAHTKRMGIFTVDRVKKTISPKENPSIEEMKPPKSISPPCDVCHSSMLEIEEKEFLKLFKEWVGEEFDENKHLNR